MRKAAEAIDDRLMSDCVTRPLPIAQARNQLDRISLILAILAVLEWHVQKQPLRLRQTSVGAPSDRRSGQTSRDGIGSERLRRTPEEVTGELIEDDHGGQQRAWSLRETAAVSNELSVQREETAADPRVDAIILGKPMRLAQLVKPEFENGGHPRRFGWRAARMRVWHRAPVDGQSGSPASRREAATCSASAGFLKGSLSMNWAIEKSGLIDKQRAALARLRSRSPRRA